MKHYQISLPINIGSLGTRSLPMCPSIYQRKKRIELIQQRHRLSRMPLGHAPITDSPMNARVIVEMMGQIDGWPNLSILIGKRPSGFFANFLRRGYFGPIQPLDKFWRTPIMGKWSMTCGTALWGLGFYWIRRDPIMLQI